MNLSKSSRSRLDPLSDVLVTLRSGEAVGSRLEAAGEWSLSFPGLTRLKFVALRRGSCCIVFPDRPTEWLEEGDIILIGRTDYVIADSLNTTPMDGLAIYAMSANGTVRLDGDDAVLVSGSVGLADIGASFVLDALPVFLRVDAVHSANAVSNILQLLDTELQADRPGGSLVRARLAELLLVEAIRAYAASDSQHAAGWIAALGDGQIGAALGLMHGRLDHPWTVPALADQVGMSRSAFSARFSARVGRPPLDYLKFWRMIVARQLLAQGSMSVERIARHVGYASQSAFTFAFRRTFNCSPRSSARVRLEH